MPTRSIKLLNEFIELALLSEKTKKKNNKKKRSKPGGGLTDIGALHHIDPNAAKAQIRAAMSAESGNVEDAADELDISSRRLYDYLQDIPGVKTAATLEDEEEEKEEKLKAQK